MHSRNMHPRNMHHRNMHPLTFERKSMLTHIPARIDTHSLGSIPYSYPETDLKSQPLWNDYWCDANLIIHTMIITMSIILRNQA
jgi:hypothetical protein